MGGESTTVKGTGIPLAIPGKTGEDTSVKKAAPVFHGNQTFYLKEWVPKLYGGTYGVDPFHKAQIVRIFYRPQELGKERSPDYSVIAAYISVNNINLSTRLSRDKYRIGVDLWEVKDSVGARIELAINLLDSGRIEETADLELKLDILNAVAEQIDKLLDADWTHIVLATAWSEVKGGKTYDRLDLNMDYFRIFYPSLAYPIGSGDKSSMPNWVNADKFISSQFPKGKIVESTRNRPGGKIGRALWNRYELKMDKSSASKFPNLKITFNHSRVDIWSEEKEKSKKMHTRWPALEDVVSDIEQELKDNPYDKAAERARKKAYEWAAKFQKMAMKYAMKNKNKLADKNNKAASDLIKAVHGSLTKEQIKLLEDLKGTDPNSKDFMAKMRKAANGAGNIQMSGAEDADGTADETIALIGEKYGEKAKGLLEKFKDVDPDAPEFKEKVKELIETGAEMGIWGSDDKDVYKDIFDEISGKFSDGMENMTDDDDWSPNKFMQFFSKNSLVGEAHKPSKENWLKLIEKNRNKMFSVYEANPESRKLNRALKGLIDIHCRVFGGEVPVDWESKHESISNYINTFRIKINVEDDLSEKLTPEEKAESTNPEMGEKI